MSRNSYDDIIEKHNNARKKEGSSRLIMATVLLALIICALAVFYWINMVERQPEYEPAAPEAPLVEPDQSLPSDSIVREAPAAFTRDNESPAASQAFVPPVAIPLDSVANLRTEQAKPVSYLNHVVEQGQTISSIAQLYSLSVNTIAAVNNITRPVSEGDVLIIPNMDGTIYTVRQGDTLSSIVQQFSLSITWKALRDINGLAQDSIAEGQRLFIPSEYLTSSEPESGVSKSAGSSSTAFINPLPSGHTTGLFNQRMDNTILDGILISADAPSPVFAALDGSVVDIRFEGNDSYAVVKLSHRDGYTTTYGRLSTEPDVSIGDRVRQGTAIGTVDSVLFFKIEMDGIPLNPASFF